MTRWTGVTLCVLIAAAAWSQGPSVPAAPPAPSADGFVVVCPITGMVDDGMAVVVARAVEEARGASALVFEVDTPGGMVDSAIEITKSIMGASCPTIAYVKGMGAISAGALISYSCKTIVMAPGTNIGASAPIVMGGAEPSEEVGEKTKSYLRSRYRALAEVNGHDPLLAEAMVDADIEVWGQRDAEGRYTFVRRDQGVDKESASEAAVDPLAPNRTQEALQSVQKEMARATETVQKALAEKNPPASPEAEHPAEPQNSPPAPDSAPSRSLAPDGMELVSRAGELLTLTTSEALKFGVIKISAETLEKALTALGYPELRREDIIPTWSERLFRWLSSPLISGLLLMMGIGGLYLEIKTPGFGLPGIIGITCLALFFGTHMVIGLANWIDLILVMTGIGLILVEVFLIPGFGLVGVSGIFCIIVGVYFALTRVPFPEYTWEFERLENAGKTVTTAAVLLVAFIILTWKLFPKTFLYRQLVLDHAQDASLGYTVQTVEQARAALGLRGVAASVLRPAGKGRFGEVTYDVVTQGDFIEPGTPIEIIQAEGNRYVVAAYAEDRKS